MGPEKKTERAGCLAVQRTEQCSVWEFGLVVQAHHASERPAKKFLQLGHHAAPPSHRRICAVTPHKMNIVGCMNTALGQEADQLLGDGTASVTARAGKMANKHIPRVHVHGYVSAGT